MAFSKHSLRIPRSRSTVGLCLQWTDGVDIGTKVFQL